MIKINIPKIKTMIEVRNAVDNNDVAELFLYGNISKYSWWDDSCISSKNVKEKLEGISTKTIKVHINSGGGDVFESIAIMNLLKQHKAKIEVYIDALAGSGASVIAMGADEIYMPSNTMMMIHQASTYAYGNADEMRKIANDLEKIDAAVTASYKKKFVGTDEELIALIKESTWLNADECLALGFCNEVLDEIEIGTEEESKEPEANIKDQILNKYKNPVNNKVPEENPKGPQIQITQKAMYKAFLENFNINMEE